MKERYDGRRSESYEAQEEDSPTLCRPCSLRGLEFTIFVFVEPRVTVHYFALYHMNSRSETKRDNKGKSTAGNRSIAAQNKTERWLPRVDDPRSLRSVHVSGGFKVQIGSH